MLTPLEANGKAHQITHHNHTSHTLGSSHSDIRLLLIVSLTQITHHLAILENRSVHFDILSTAAGAFHNIFFHSQEGVSTCAVSQTNFATSNAAPLFSTGCIVSARADGFKVCSVLSAFCLSFCSSNQSNHQPLTTVSFAKF